MPADTQVASGWSGRMRVATSQQPGEGRVRVGP